MSRFQRQQQGWRRVPDMRANAASNLTTGGAERFIYYNEASMTDRAGQFHETATQENAPGLEDDAASPTDVRRSDADHRGYCLTMPPTRFIPLPWMP